MRRALLLLILLGLLFSAVWLFKTQPGAVTLHWFDHRIDTSMGVLAALLFLLIATAIFVNWLWRTLVGAPSDFARYRHERRRVKAYQALTHGFAAIATGDTVEARRRAKQAGALLKNAPLARLLLAQTAELEGDKRTSSRHLQALLASPETSFLALRGLFHQAMADGNEIEALRLARQAVTERPGTSWAMSALLDLELKRGDLAAAEQALDRAERSRLIDTARAKRTRAVLLTERARLAQPEEAAATILRQAIKLAPDLVPARVQLTRALLQSGRIKEAYKIAAQGWGESPHADVAAALLAADDGDSPMPRLKRIEKLVAAAPTHLESRLLLAEANLAAGLWGPARAQLEEARTALGNGVHPPRRLARLMARLEESEGKDPAAAHRWLLLAAEAAPEHGWLCSACGAPSAIWTANCGHCRSFDSLRWRAVTQDVLELLPAVAAAPAEDRPAEPVALPRATGSAPPKPPALPGAEVPPVDAARSVN
jgi:HemY protein